MDPNAPTDETMSEGSSMPASDADDAMGENVICVPVDSLSVPEGDTDQMTPPEQGDKVQANIEGEVVKVEGKDAYVKLHAVNGQEVQADEEEPSQDQQDASEEQALQGMAAQQPDNY